jgi:CheY-like chemotaxis protein/HPt (histidine-containing phosphotransfer) domain-containing protein
MLGLGEDRRLPVVLIIDDDMVSREVTATVLTMSGYTVHAAASGTESLALIDGARCVPEVILMDAQMPGLSGTHLIEQLRARTSASLYAMSGSDTTTELKAASDGFLLKPFGPEALQRLLEKHSTEIESVFSPDAAVVSPTILARLREMMPEKAVREIYAALVADLDKRNLVLKEAVKNGDVGAIRRTGHSIKGGCGMAGAEQAARLGALLEAGGDNLDNIREILKELHWAARNLQRMLDSEFKA